MDSDIALLVARRWSVTQRTSAAICPVSPWSRPQARNRTNGQRKGERPRAPQNQRKTKKGKWQKTKINKKWRKWKKSRPRAPPSKEERKKGPKQAHGKLKSLCKRYASSTASSYHPKKPEKNHQEQNHPGIPKKAPDFYSHCRSPSVGTAPSTFTVELPSSKSGLLRLVFLVLLNRANNNWWLIGW